jgi:(1->4)-alpha-D-glucan 1-alpha-D-glucosylmutase
VWTDALSQRTVDGGAVRLDDLVGASDGLPVALLIRVGNDV